MSCVSIGKNNYVNNYSFSKQISLIYHTIWFDV